MSTTLYVFRWLINHGYMTSFLAFIFQKLTLKEHSLLQQIDIKLLEIKTKSQFFKLTSGYLRKF